ncbi:MAG: GIY-YIG nuclease family protein [Pseudomonadota bacterium]|nr:GIY-YIG nuclease family protein [Pseudomonadota bacterium]
MEIKPFEPTTSWAYHFARHVAVPQILQMTDVQRGEPFCLIEQARKVIEQRLSQEQQVATILRKESRRLTSVSAAIRWYVPFIAKNTKQLVSLGSGMFRLPQLEDLDEDEVESEAIDAAADAGLADDTDLSGWLYAFTFDLIIKTVGPFPIKIGRADDVEKRVSQQCRGSAVFQQPRILKRWKVKNQGAAERSVHNVLRYRGKWCAEAPGVEWFNTTTEKVDSVVAFLERST